jgi:hypothetical protein
MFYSISSFEKHKIKKLTRSLTGLRYNDGDCTSLQQPHIQNLIHRPSCKPCRPMLLLSVLKTLHSRTTYNFNGPSNSVLPPPYPYSDVTRSASSNFSRAIFRTIHESTKGGTIMEPFSVFTPFNYMKIFTLLPRILTTFIIIFLNFKNSSFIIFIFFF